AVVERQTILRTAIREVEGVPYQFVEPARSVEMRTVDFADSPDNPRVHDLLTEESRRPFDLMKDLPIRALVLRFQAEDHILLLTLHHIASDGWSRSILLRELGEFYSALAAERTIASADLPIQYADYAQWQRAWLEEGPQQAQLGYWLRQLAEAPAALNFPTDHPRPSVESHRGAREIASLDSGLLEGLKALSRQQNVTLFMTLLAAFQTLLHRYSG